MRQHGGDGDDGADGRSAVSYAGFLSHFFQMIPGREMSPGIFLDLR